MSSTPASSSNGSNVVPTAPPLVAAGTHALAQPLVAFATASATASTSTDTRGGIDRTVLSMAPKFTGTDYPGYALKMTSVLRYAGLWPVVSAPIPGTRLLRSVIADGDDEDDSDVIGDSDTHAERKDDGTVGPGVDPVLYRQMELAYLILQTSIKDEATLQLITDVPFPNAYELWRRLGAHFEMKTQGSILHLQQEFANMKQRVHENAASYIARFKRVLLSLKQCGEPVGNTMLRHRFVAGLDSKFDLARSTLEATDGITKKSFEQICEYILSQEFHIANRHGSKASQSSAHGADASDSCYNCGEKGHHAKSCGNPKKDGSASPRQGGGNRPLCTFCKLKGHEESKCWKKHGKPGASKTLSFAGSAQQNAGGHVAEVVTQSSAPDLALKASVTIAAPVSGPRRFSLDSMILDSGASSFILKGDTPLSNAMLCEDKSIRIANGEVLSGLTSGTLMMESADGKLQMKLENTLTHSGIQSNLLSVHGLMTSPEVAGMWFTGEKAQLIGVGGKPPTGEVLLEADQVQGLYRVDGMKAVQQSASALNAAVIGDAAKCCSGCRVFQPDEEYTKCQLRKQGKRKCKKCVGIATAFLASGNAELGQLWHRRLAHLSSSGMEKLITAKVLTGLDGLKPIDCKCDGVCEGCMKGKAHQAAYGKLPSDRNKATRPLERVHLDVCGPMQVESLSGSKYLLVIVDEFSRRAWGFCIKQKSEAAGKILNWCREASVKLSLPIVEMHSDNGGEFLNDTLVSFCRSVGTKMTTSPPYTPQHNAIAERMMRTIVEPARSLLYQAGAPLILWGEAMQAVIYTRNLVGVRKESKLTPDMMFHRGSAKTDVQHLREWGCDAWVHVPDEQRQKLDAKSVVCIFIGYGDDGYGYRLFDVATRRVIRSRNVTFAEGRFTQCKRLRDDELLAADGVAAPKSDDEYYQFIDDHRFRNEMKLHQLMIKEAKKAAKKDAEVDAIVPVQDSIVDALMLPADNHVPVAEDVVPFVAPLQDAQPPPAAAVAPPADWNLARDREPRQRRPASRYGMVDLDDVGASLAEFAAKAAVESGSDPVSLKVALSGSDATHWKSAVEAELRSLVKHGTMQPYNLPSGRKAIGSKIVLKKKSNGIFKARIVVKGYAQREGVDYFKTFAPVLGYQSVRVHFGIVASEDLEMEAMDVSTAFLNAKLDEDVYITLPPGIDGIKGTVSEKEEKSTQVYKLLKSLYGIKQAPHDWNQEINKTIVGLGYTRLTSDTCMYVKMSKTNRPITIPLFVDDLFPSFHRDDRAEWYADKKSLMSTYDMKDLGEATSVLGMRITRDRKNRTLTVDQEDYINRLLLSCDMQDCIPADTPEEPGMHHSAVGRSDSSSSQKASTARSEAKDRDIEVGELLKLRYGSVVGSVLYAALSTRPDISHAVSVLAQFVSAPLPQHWDAAMRVLRYLKGTAHLGLVFRGTGDLTSGVNLDPCYTDSDWGGDIDDRKSRSGVVCKLAGSAVSWLSKKQTTVALSSAEAEYGAAGEAVKFILWLRQLLMELGYPQLARTILLGDNQVCIAIASNDVFHSRTKHIDMRHHFIRDHVNDGKDAVIDLKWISTSEQQADIFTKALGKVQFLFLRSQIMGHSAPDRALSVLSLGDIKSQKCASSPEDVRRAQKCAFGQNSQRRAQICARNSEEVQTEKCAFVDSEEREEDRGMREEEKAQKCAWSSEQASRAQKCAFHQDMLRRAQNGAPCSEEAQVEMLQEEKERKAQESGEEIRRAQICAPCSLDSSSSIPAEEDRPAQKCAFSHPSLQSHSAAAHESQM